MKSYCEIIDVVGRQILDSRCFPTVEVEVYLEDGTVGRAADKRTAFSGRSTSGWKDLDHKRIL